jgi:hypothetical protein
LLRIGQLFLLGCLVTAVFSGSLFVLTRDVSLAEVLIVGLVVPSFTWVVQMSSSWFLLPTDNRTRYWNDLGWICVLGSFALLPAAAVNLLMEHPPAWLSAANVLASVAIMAGDLFRRCAAQRVSWWWPVSWCFTISLNMAIFLWTSWRWWA